jgi:hypothetical protein
MAGTGWDKKRTDKPYYLGVRAAGLYELGLLSSVDQDIVDTVLEAMAWGQLIIFRYGDSDRVVAPFVLGASSDWKPLLRGYQLEGSSRSGKGPGWRVFQVEKISLIDNFQDFFDPDEFVFNELYPWTYYVFATL